MIAIGSFLGAAASAAGGVAGAATSFTALSSATSALTGKFNEIVNIASRFVSALDPAIVNSLNRVFHDLDAVIGVALVPIIQNAAVVVRGVADALLPIMEKLNPIIGKLASTIGQSLQPVIDAVADIFLSMMPIMEQGAEIFGQLFRLVAQVATNLLVLIRPIVEMFAIFDGPLQAAIIGIIEVLGDFARVNRVLMEIVSSVVVALAEFLGTLFGKTLSGGIRGAMNDLRTAFQELSKSAILVAAQFFRLMGMTRFLDALIRGVEGTAKNRGDSRGYGVTQNVSITDAASIGRSMAQATFAASAFGKKDTGEQTVDWLKDIAGQLKDIRDSDGIKEQIDKHAKKVVAGIASAINDQLPGGATGAAGRGINFAMQSPGGPAAALFGAILGAFGR